MLSPNQLIHSVPAELLSVNSVRVKGSKLTELNKQGDQILPLHWENHRDSFTMARVLAAAAGAGLAVVGVPAAIGALGFTAAGITAGSIASWMMSAAAIANGGGVAAGSVVAFFQTVGAAGLSAAGSTVAAGIGGAAGAVVAACFF
ncbi:hypothetical protein AGOR_G00101980 [Albula goreensis]|uniref:Uncharacterized protein n=1 Tax=Albula goreensis TaxID=1534307 RepID=A0A8T3DDX9_9TELE|nr:hypothetical protein AGOR_G00101980 [Albula goreensis]